MNQEVIQHGQQPVAFPNRSTLPASVNAGAVAIEQERAIAEAQGQLILAKKFPRDVNAAYAELMEACKLMAFASVAFYTVPQGGQKVTGPSIRLAEEIARVYGNFEFGHRELSRTEATPTTFGRSEIEVYAWDKEKNNRSIRQITVLHVMDTREGPKKLRDQRDIDNKIANVASKQVRGRILSSVPKWLVESAIQECQKTLAGNNDEPVSVRVRKMTQAFAKFGVTSEHLEKYLGHSLDQTLADELVDLTGVFNSIRDGAAPSEFFGGEGEAESSESESAKESLAATAKQQAAKPRRQPAAKAEQAAAPQPEPQAQQEPKAEPEPAQQPAAAEDSKPEQNESKPAESESTAPVAEAATEAQGEQSQQQNQQPEDFF